MDPTRHSKKIGALRLLTTVLFLITVTGVVSWMSSQLNQRAATDSVSMLAGVVTELQDQLRTIGVDYSHWDTAHVDIRDGDLDAFYDNYAVGATDGEAMHLLAVDGGPLAAPLSWTEDGSAEPVPDLVPAEVIDVMRERLQAVQIGATTVPQFFAPVGEDLFLFAGSMIQPQDIEEFGIADVTELALSIMGFQVGDEMLAETQEKYRLTQMRLVEMLRPGALSRPLVGQDGTAIAHIEWEALRPGDAMLLRVLTPLGVVAMIFIAIAAVVTMSTRRNACMLVDQEARAAKAAREDSLTGLPNRYAFNERLGRIEANTAPHLALLFLDVNGFKAVNDTVGHQGGDKLVIMIADRLRSLDIEPSFIARTGGDEFVLLVEGPDAALRALKIAHLVRVDLLPQFVVQGRAFHIGFAIGIASRTTADVSSTELLRRADLAMYEAKRLRASEPVIYDPSFEHNLGQRQVIEEALRQALVTPDEFSILYQPIVDCQNKQMVKAEALARWTSKSIGMIRPDIFIGVAEETGLMLQLGQLLLTKIFRDMVRVPDLRVSINISPIQLNDGNFVTDMILKLKSMNIDPDRIDIEITEGLVVSNIEMAALRLDMLHEAGLRTSLDDFGTGSSSIGYLKKLPFDTLKIDKSFVDTMCASPQGVGMVQAMILMGHSLGQQVVCEGVETQEQADTLQDLGCDLLQGYLYSKPVPIEDLKFAEVGARNATAA